MAVSPATPDGATEGQDAGAGGVGDGTVTAAGRVNAVVRELQEATRGGGQLCCSRQWAGTQEERPGATLEEAQAHLTAVGQLFGPGLVTSGPLSPAQAAPDIVSNESSSRPASIHSQP